MNIAAGLFKAQCLRLMDQVAETHETITVTKRGRAVARLMPVAPVSGRPLFGYLRGKGEVTGDIVASTGEN